MNKTKILTLIFCLLQISIFGQKKTVTTTVQYGVENQELFELFQFQNLAVEKFTFQGNEIKNKSYKIFIKEFKDGKLTDTKVLFDGTETDYFKIEYSQLKFKIFSDIKGVKKDTKLIYSGYDIPDSYYFDKKHYYPNYNDSCFDEESERIPGTEVTFYEHDGKDKLIFVEQNSFLKDFVL